MTPAKVLLVTGVAVPVLLGALFALTHTRSEVDAYLATSRSITSVLFPLAVLLIAVGVVGLAVAKAL